MAAFPVFDSTTQKTMKIIDEVSMEGNIHDREIAFKALRGTLHTLRDRLPVNESAQVGAQLPILLTGFYYEGWRPAATPRKDRTREEFLAHIQEYLSDKAPDLNASHATQTVFRVLSNNVAEGEVEDIMAALPEELQELWPEKAQQKA